LKQQAQYRTLRITLFGRVYPLVVVELRQSFAPVGNRPPIPRSSTPSLVAAAPELSYSGSTSCTVTFDLYGYNDRTTLALALPCPMTEESLQRRLSSQDFLPTGSFRNSV
jgi:hypothetical protein